MWHRNSVPSRRGAQGRQAVPDEVGFALSSGSPKVRKNSESNHCCIVYSIPWWWDRYVYIHVVGSLGWAFDMVSCLGGPLVQIKSNQQSTLVNSETSRNLNLGAFCCNSMTIQNRPICPGGIHHGTRRSVVKVQNRSYLPWFLRYATKPDLLGALPRQRI